MMFTIMLFERALAMIHSLCNNSSFSKKHDTYNNYYLQMKLDKLDWKFQEISQIKNSSVFSRIKF